MSRRNRGNTASCFPDQTTAAPEARQSLPNISATIQSTIMQTLLRLLRIARDARSEADILDFVDGELNRCLDDGDLLGRQEDRSR